MKTFFLDSGYIIALEAEDDQNHHSASEHWKSLVADPPKLLTTSYVVSEIVTFFNSRDRHQKAVEIADSLINSKFVEIVHVDESLFYAGLDFFKIYDDKRFSLTDCISFLVMKDKEIDSALSFDKHFTQAGFGRFPN